MSRYSQICCYYAPALIDWGHIVFALSVCLSVFVCKKLLTLAVTFEWQVIEPSLFHMCIPCGKTSFDTKVKVICQGHTSRLHLTKNRHGGGALIIHRHSFFFLWRRILFSLVYHTFCYSCIFISQFLAQKNLHDVKFTYWYLDIAMHEMR